MEVPLPFAIPLTALLSGLGRAGELLLEPECCGVDVPFDVVPSVDLLGPLIGGRLSQVCVLRCSDPNIYINYIYYPSII